jgi:hypothetical protein
MSINKQYFWVVACIFLSVQASGQVAHSPFTKYGIGESYSTALANTQGMAGIGVSHPQTWYINNQNPALLVHNKLATFQMGMLAESRKLKSSTASEKNIGGNLNYLVLSFSGLKNPSIPLPNRWSTSLGLMPYTSVNYRYESSALVEGSSQSYNTVHEGSGGITQLFWSNGVLINKNFSVGAKISYLFGSIDVIHKLKLPGGLTSAPQDKTVVKDFNLELGGSYSKDSLWGNDYRLSAGIVYNLSTDLNAKLIHKNSSLSSSDDTLSAVITTRTNGQIHIPAAITTGISFAKSQKWVVGTEFTYQDWSSFRNVNGLSEDLNKAWKIGLGGEYTPDPYAAEGFLKRTTYRVGVTTEQLPFSINDKPVKDSGINLGFSFPAGRSSLDLAFKFGKRGNKSQSVLEETYFKVFFGITFNDQWFIRRRFD